MPLYAAGVYALLFVCDLDECAWTGSVIIRLLQSQVVHFGREGVLVWRQICRPAAKKIK